MYFQHHSGDIRFQRLTDKGEWVGGSESEIVASNAKNSTPLSAVAYVLNEVSQWHIFCKLQVENWPTTFKMLMKRSQISVVMAS